MVEFRLQLHGNPLVESRKARAMAKALDAFADHFEMRHSESDLDAPDELEQRLMAEVAATESTAGLKAAEVPGSSAVGRGPARFAEELGDAAPVLREILDTPPDVGPAAGSTVFVERDGTPHFGWPNNATTLLRLLRNHPTEPGKIVICGLEISLGDACKYRDQLDAVIKTQRETAFGTDFNRTTVERRESVS